MLIVTFKSKQSIGGITENMKKIALLSGLVGSCMGPIPLTPSSPCDKANDTSSPLIPGIFQ